MTPLRQDLAELLAIKALSWLVGNEELLPVFLGASGASISDLRERAADPDFLVSVLEFLLMDDQWIKDFCAVSEYALEDPLRAHGALAGDANINWT